MAHHPTKITCARCGQSMDATRSTCPHCGGPHQLSQGPAEVPPALAILVALGLLTGVLLLILLVTKASGPHHPEAGPPTERSPARVQSPTPVAAPVAASATPAAPAPPTPATPAPPARPAKPLPSAPAPGERPQKLGMPPDVAPPVGPGGVPSPAQHFPPPP